MSTRPSRITDASAPAPAAPAGQLKNAKKQVKTNPAKNVVAAPTPAADAASTATAAKIQQAVGGGVTITQSNSRSRTRINQIRDKSQTQEKVRGSADVRPKERSSIAPPKKKNEERRTMPAISLEPKEVTASTSFNSIGKLNWNVTGTPNGEDADDDWSINEVIFAVAEKPELEDKEKRRHHHRHHHHHHHRNSDIKEEKESRVESRRGSKLSSKRRESKADTNTNALIKTENNINANPMVWSQNPESFGLGKKIKEFDGFTTPKNAGTQSYNLPRKSLSAVNQRESNLGRTFDNHEEASLTWSAPGDIGAEKGLIRPSVSIDGAFQSFQETRYTYNRRKTEDVESIISTALSETKVIALHPKGPRINIRKRIGLAFVGVAMVCGIAGVGVFSSPGDFPPHSRGEDEGGGGGLGRSRGNNTDVTGCDDPLAILASFPSIQIANLKCSMDMKKDGKYRRGTVCAFSCDHHQRLEGPDMMRCHHLKNANTYFWCHVVSPKECRYLDFEATPSKCVDRTEQKTATSKISSKRRLDEVDRGDKQKNTTAYQIKRNKRLAMEPEAESELPPDQVKRNRIKS